MGTAKLRGSLEMRERGRKWSPKSLSSCRQLLNCNIPANGPCLPQRFAPEISPRLTQLMLSPVLLLFAHLFPTTKHLPGAGTEPLSIVISRI